MNSTFEKFDLLPSELKLLIINYADALSLTNLLKSNRELRELSLYILNEKISSLTGLKNLETALEDVITRSSDLSSALSGLSLISSYNDKNKKSTVSSIPNARHQYHQYHHNLISEKTDNVLISFYSPQNVENKVELYETKCLSNQNSNTSTGNASSFYNSSNATSSESLSLQEKGEEDLMVNDKNLSKLDDMLNNIDQTEDIYSTSKFNTNENLYSCFELGSLVKTRNPLTKKITTTTNSKKTLPMNLLIDEDSNLAKLTIQLSISNQVTIFDKTEFFKTEWADEDSKILISTNRKYGFMFKLIKGEELPPRSPYDYEALTNYYLDINNFMINNCYLLKCVEDAQVC